MSSTMLVIALLAGCIAFAIVWRRSAAKGIDRWLRALTPLFLAISICAGVAISIRRASAPWTSPRTVAPVALWRGFNIYPAPSDGPEWSNIYPPVAFILQSPAGLAHTSSGAIAIAQVITTGAYLGALLFMMLRILPRGPDRLLAILISISVAMLISWQISSLADAAFSVHVDGIAVALALAACAAVLGPPRKTELLEGFTLSAVCIALAIFAKQTMLPMAIAVSVWIALKERLESGLVHFACVLVALLIVGFAMAAWFGTANLWFHLITIPSHHGFHGEFPGNLLRALAVLHQDVFPLPELAVIASILTARASSLRSVLKTPAGLMLLVAAAEFPLALLGYLKLGGEKNNFSYSLYFILAALVIMLAQWIASPTLRAHTWRQATLLAFLIITSSFAARVVLQLALAERTEINPHELSFEVIKKNPGQVYFPDFPLSHLLAEGKAYHFDWGLRDRGNAGMKITREQFERYAPAHPTFICFPSKPLDDSDTYLMIRDQFPFQVQLDALPGWYCLTRLKPSEN